MPNLKKVIMGSLRSWGYSGHGLRSCFLLFLIQTYGSWGQVLLFAFTHTNAIYTNALYCVRSSSFYKWEGERGKISC